MARIQVETAKDPLNPEGREYVRISLSDGEHMKCVDLFASASIKDYLAALDVLRLAWLDHIHGARGK